MDYLKQFKLLFNQRLLLRRRQPVIFSLELFWPAIVFLAVLFTRYNFPRNHKETCTYNPKALPSTGAVNFLQSFVCTLDNPCLNDTINEEINKFPKARIHQFVQHINPLFDNQEEVIKKLPKGIRLIDTVINTISKNSLISFLENGIHIKELFQDETIFFKAKSYVEESFKKNESYELNDVEAEINNLYYSSLNIISLVQSFKNNNFKYTKEQYSCNLNLFNEILIFKNDISQLEAEKTVNLLCRLSNQGDLDGLLEITQNSIDSIKFLKWITNLLQILDLKEQKSHINNIILMISIVRKNKWLNLKQNWNISNSSNSRLNDILIQLTENDFIVSLEKLVQQKNLETILSIISENELENKDQQISTELKSVKTGLNSLQYFKNLNLFQIKYKFKELIQNIDSVKIFMEMQLQLKPSLINIIINTAFDFTETITNGNVDPFLFCNYNALKTIILLDENLSKDYDNKLIFDLTSNAICTLSTAEGYFFSNQLMKIFAVKKLVNNALKIISTEILNNQNITQSEVPNALSGLKAVSSSIKKVKPFIKKFVYLLNLDNSNFNLKIDGDAFDLISSLRNNYILDNLMCGKELSLKKNDFELLKSSKIKQPKIDYNELAFLNSEFCRNGYLQIMQMQGGPMIWTWLKPIISGKVLYSPKNYASNSIINELNSTFNSIESLIKTLKAWTETIQSLKSFVKSDKVIQKIKNSESFLPLILEKEFNDLISNNETIEFIEKLNESIGVIDLIEMIGNLAQCFETDRFIGYSNEYKLEQAAKKFTKSHSLIAGVVFMNLDMNLSNKKNTSSSIENQKYNFPKKIKYKLRADIDFVPGTKMLKERIWEPGPKDHFNKDLGYFKGFIQLQEMLDHSIMKVQLKQIQKKKNDDMLLEPEFSFENYANSLNEDFNLEIPMVYMQQMPYACYEEDKFGFYILALSPVISTVAWIFLIAFSIRDFVLERELKLEEILYVIGLKPSIRWITWFIFAFFSMAFGCVCGISIFKYADIIPNSDFVLVYIYFLIFCFSVVMFCYMISAFFKTATLASLSGIIVYLASYLPFMVAITLEHELTLLNKLFSCLSMSTAFCFGIMYLARFEQQGVGIQWNNIYQSPMAEDTMNFAYSAFLMVFDGFLYFIIGWYFNNVLATTNYGKKPFYFFLTPSYWNLCSSNYKFSDYDEKIANSSQRGLNINNLSIIYNKGNKKKEHQAVSSLTMKIEEGQIATLLGKNGAGKTSTISVLTGILKPTSGSIYVYGQEFLKNFKNTRKLLGYCPQYNVLFDRLTVREHLDFFSRLKNLLPEKKINADVELMLKATGLSEVQHQLAMNLSGGLQRRLCVAIAFIGGSKLIILDEPTASVDPIARRQIWDLIVSQKSTRTVLLTTHHMDEADILSDNVAIIHKGKLLCHGSPLLLKSKFGCGYQLTISRYGENQNSKNKINEENIKILVTDFDKENQISNEEYEETGTDHLNVTDSDSGRVSNNSIHLNNSKLDYKNNDQKVPDESSSEKLMQFIRCLIPNALKLDENLNELVIALPKSSIDGTKHDYSTFFQCLDSNISRFGYHSYGLTSTTLEEVFLTLCSLQDSRFDLIDSLENKLELVKKLNSSINSFYNFNSKSQPNQTDFYSDEFNSKPNNHSSKKKIIYSGIQLKIIQFKGLVKKRACHTFTNWKTLFYNLIFPCIFIAFAMGLTTIKPTLAPDPILPLSPAIYGSEATSFYVFKQQFYDDDTLSSIQLKTGQLLKKKVSLIKNNLTKDNELECGTPRKGWLVSKCPVVKKSFKTKFPSYLLNFTETKKNNKNDNTCSCSQCLSFDYKGNVDLPVETAVGYVYDLSNVSNLNHFLMNTFTLFNERRYGGWSLHHLNFSDNIINENNSFVKKEVWKVWFDNNGAHAIPSYLNTLNNALFRSNLIKLGGLSEEQALDYSIISYSHPFHIRSAQLGDQNLMQKAGDAGIALIILVGFVFIPTSFVFYIVKERKNEEKHMQRIFGVGTTLYWIVAIICDMVVIVFSVLISGLIIWSFQMPIYTAKYNFPAIMLLLLLFGWAMVNVVYLLEKFFDEASIAFMVIYCLSLFVGINTMVFRLLIDVFNLLQVTTTFKLAFERIALAFPPFALMSGLVDITKNHLLSEMFSLINQDVYVYPFSMDLLGFHYVTLAAEGFFLFIVNLIIELFKNGDLWFLKDIFLCYGFKFTSNAEKVQTSTSSLLNALDLEENHYVTVYENGLADSSMKNKLAPEEDHDVYEERKRIILSELNMKSLYGNQNFYKCGQNMNSKDVLKVVNVSKSFCSVVPGNKNKIAVNKISFGVPQSECFGLLGTNGAGKTTLFKILTGQISPTSGTTLFNQQEVEKVLSSTCKILGYCPQKDALDSTLTPKQHLSIYALIRGIKYESRKKLVKESLIKFQLNQYRNFPVSSLSRGTKRKLCLAIAMLGDPQIILLDEPTSGMDPMSRRCLWQNIQSVIKDKRSVLLTSHSMEECDVLCSRIAIMVNGKFSCLGSPQYLKRKYGYGYTIVLRLNETNMNYTKAISFIKNHFPNIILRAHHHNMLEFSLPTNDILLSKIFSYLDDAKIKLNLQDYSISQTTLDQVFVNFASQESTDFMINSKKNSDTELSYLQDLAKRKNLTSHSNNQNKVIAVNNIKELISNTKVVNSNDKTIYSQISNQLIHLPLEKQSKNQLNAPKMNEFYIKNLQNQNQPIYYNTYQTLTDSRNNNLNYNYLSSSNIYYSISKPNLQNTIHQGVLKKGKKKK